MATLQPETADTDLMLRQAGTVPFPQWFQPRRPGPDSPDRF